MMNKKKLSDEFRTPPKLFKELYEIFNFFWDACCDTDNCLSAIQNQLWKMNILQYPTYDYRLSDMLKNWEKCDEYGTKSYEKAIFMNPPYSDPMPFIKKAWEDSKHFKVVMLLKADMSTDWFNYAPEQGAKTFICPPTENLRGLLGGLVKRNNPYQCYVVPLRKRIKFYVSEEVFQNDKNNWSGKTVLGTPRNCDRYTKNKILLETKNYKRVDDGIVSKNTANFPSLIMIFDRRGSND